MVKMWLKHFFNTKYDLYKLKLLLLWLEATASILWHQIFKSLLCDPIQKSIESLC
jgi:hypothetical protein